MKSLNEIEPFSDPLEALQRLISRFDNQGVIIGGIAASILGEPRYTQDIDAVFLLTIDEIPQFLIQAKTEGIVPRIQDATDFAERTRVLLLKHQMTDTNIDISLGLLPFEQEMVERSVEYEIDEALRIRLPTVEDLIILKAVANRPKDLEDIKNLVHKYPALDHPRIEKWVKAFAEALENPQVWNDLKTILTSIG